MYKLKNSRINGNNLDLIEPFLHNKRQKVVLNGQSLNWKFVKAGVPQGSVSGSLFFLTYINDLPQGILSDVKLATDNTSLFSNVICRKASTSALNSDLLKIQDWVYQWKCCLTQTKLMRGKKLYF